MGKVFISYSHEDETWKDRLMVQLNVPAKEGFFTLWNDRDIKPGDDWFPAIETALTEAEVVIMIISAEFLISDFIRREEVPRILERRQTDGVLVVPLIVKPCAWKRVEWLAAMQVTPPDGKPLMGGTDYEIETQLAELTDKICALIESNGQPCPQPGKTLLEPDMVSLSKLPVTGAELFGRERELTLLDDAWADDHTHIVTLTAWGGVGKTALVNHWLNRMERENYGGARRVYGWSFYSQGAEEGKQASADEFLQETLTWFGDNDPKKGAPEEKARRLAQLVSKEKTLLILDGMEPHQYPPGQVKGLDGQFKDRGMRTFLRELAGFNRGLCVISSRETVTDLRDKFTYTVKTKNLEQLSPGAGGRLLESLGITGRKKDILAAAEEYGGHALALTLLGRHIADVYQGDIRKRDLVPQLTTERIQGGHAWRVMAAYEKWLGETAELSILYIMGLFDRPVETGAIEAVTAAPAIPGVTGQLQRLAETGRQGALSNLRAAGLLAEYNRQRGQRGDVLDCHPLVREYFGARLRDRHPGGWQEAHKRLYHYYRDLPEKTHPDTLQEMEPLFAAVAHGCRAGLHFEAEVDVYWERISRKDEQYIKHKLGAFGADLSALSHFFEVPWSRPASGLPDGDKAVILSWSAFGLRAVGRLREALQPMKAGLEIVVEQENWKQAAIHANNLSELLLTLGEVSEATDYARRSVTHADRSGDEFQKESKRASLADALHQAGQCAEAEKWFREAEAILKKRQPHYSYLYSGSGFKFCDLLLAQGKVTEVRERAEKALEIVLNGSKSLLDISLNNLTLGRAWMSRAGSETTADFRRAMEYLDRAVNGLRDSGNMDDLPRGLLARAECYRRQHQFKSAWQDLKEATEIADSGEMKLHQTDAHLLALQLCQDQGKHDQAMEHRREAGRLIEETGYFRRGEI